MGWGTDWHKNTSYLGSTIYSYPKLHCKHINEMIKRKWVMIKQTLIATMLDM